MERAAACRRDVAEGVNRPRFRADVLEPSEGRAAVATCGRHAALCLLLDECIRTACVAECRGIVVAVLSRGDAQGGSTAIRG